MVKKGTDMKKNAVLFFFKSLLKSILVIVSILAVGVISYKVSYQYLSKQLEEGKLDVIREYLRKHVHRYGKMKDSREILKDMTGEDFNPQYYVEYLEEKYRRLYAV